MFKKILIITLVLVLVISSVGYTILPKEEVLETEEIILTETPRISFADFEADEIEEPIPTEEIIEEVEEAEEIIEEEILTSEKLYEASYFNHRGVIQYNDSRWTWYSQRVLPGGALVIPGRHIDENGYVCDENDQICLASCDEPKGTVIQTPFGKNGCVYDYCMVSGTIDVYVNW